MPLPVIPNIFQAVLVWGNSSAPRAASNRLHFQDTVTTQSEADLFADLDANVTAAMWSYGVTASRVTQVNITKLDGTSAQKTFSPAAATKWQGGNTGDILLSPSVVVSLKSNRRGPRGRNRIYLPWPAESTVTNGGLANGNVTGMNAAWAAFQAAMGTAGWNLVAISEQYGDGNPVTSIVTRSSLKSQRRRQLR